MRPASDSIVGQEASRSHTWPSEVIRSGNHFVLSHDRVRGSLREETIRTVDKLDKQMREEETLRQSAHALLSVIQRARVQLIELRPTNNHEADQKLQVCANAHPTSIGKRSPLR